MFRLKMRKVLRLSREDLLMMLSTRHANAGNNARGYGPARGQDDTPAICECTFVGFMKCNPTAFHGTKGYVELQRWFEKSESVFGISECAEGKKVKFVVAALQGPALTWWNAKIQGYYKKDFPKLKNKNHGNQAGNGGAQ
ncbi:hypothetical protein Tco_0114238, partial [Tanacetum coccineum]